jgi:hypothetical protein
MTSKTKDIQTTLEDLSEYDGNSVDGEYPHGLGWCEKGPSSEKILISKGPSESFRIHLIDYSKSKRSRLGGANDRVSYQESITIEGEEHSAIIIQYVQENRYQKRNFLNLCVTLASELDSNPTLGENTICGILRTSLSTLVDRGGLIDENKMLGLTGELLLLRQMLIGADQREGLTLENALETWQSLDNQGQGHEEKRDFGGHEIAIEVKTTRNTERIHNISDWSQLWPIENLELYVCSVSLMESRDGVHSMPDLIRLIHDQLTTYDPNLGKEFWKKLEAQGVFKHQLQSYDLDPIYRSTFDTALRLASEEGGILLNITFEGGSPPPNVSEISYNLKLDEADMINDFTEILCRMMGIQ